MELQFIFTDIDNNKTNLQLNIENMSTGDICSMFDYELCNSSGFTADINKIVNEIMSIIKENSKNLRTWVYYDLCNESKKEIYENFVDQIKTLLLTNSMKNLSIS